MTNVMLEVFRNEYNKNVRCFKIWNLALKLYKFISVCVCICISVCIYLNISIVNNCKYSLHPKMKCKYKYVKFNHENF